MKKFKFYRKGLTIRAFVKVDRFGNHFEVLKLLKAKYPDKDFFEESKLSEEEYIFLCDELYDSVDKFMVYNYGSILYYKQLRINDEIKDWKEFIKKWVQNEIALNTKEIAERLTPVRLSTSKLFGLINTELNISLRTKVGDNDTVSVYYRTKIGNCSFITQIESSSEYSGTPSAIYREYKNKETQMNNEIDEFNMNFLSNIFFFKVLDLTEIDLDNIFTKTIDKGYSLNYSRFDDMKIELEKHIKSKFNNNEYKYYIIEKKNIINPSNYFEIINNSNIKELLYEHKDTLNLN